MNQSTVDIVIVNWNSGKYLHDCLMSMSTLLNQVGVFVYIVDNNSTDSSLEYIEKLDLGIDLTIIRNTNNRGFGAACNQGAGLGKSKYILFLNPDTRLFEDSLTKPLNFLDDPENSEIGICGVQLLNDDNEISCSCSRFPTPKIMISTALGLQYLLPTLFQKQQMIDWSHLENKSVDQVMGAFFLIRRTLFETLSGFDERFFVFFEEVDLSWRANRIGSRSFYLSEAKIYHKGGGTTEKLRKISLFYYLRSRILYAYKHFNILIATIILFSTLFVEPFLRLLRSKIVARDNSFSQVFQAYLLLYRWCLGFN